MANNFEFVNDNRQKTFYKVEIKPYDTPISVINILLRN